MRKVLCAIFLGVMTLAAKDRPSIQPAPLPSQLVTAKRVFVAKGVGATAYTVEGGYDLAFDSFYSAMKRWGRYEIAASPEEADLIFEVSYRAGSGGTRVWSSGTQVYSHQIVDLQLSLVVYDSHSKTELWSTTVPPGMARRRKNQEKEMVIAGERLVQNLKQRPELSTASSPPTTNSQVVTPK